MIMPAGRPLLLPANPRFIAWTLLLSLMLHMLLSLSGQFWLPDMLQLVLIFWCVHQPRRVGMLAAFLFGLLVDVHESALLGQNALAYVVLAYLAHLMHRRLLMFPLREQVWQVLPIFVLGATVEWLTRLITHDSWPQWTQLLAPLLQTALWPLAGFLLLAPQRRPVDRDNIRPL